MENKTMHYGAYLVNLEGIKKKCEINRAEGKEVHEVVVEIEGERYEKTFDQLIAFMKS